MAKFELFIEVPDKEGVDAQMGQTLAVMEEVHDLFAKGYQTCSTTYRGAKIDYRFVPKAEKRVRKKKVKDDLQTNQPE